jgi:putative Mg2+ transporter-C (MgtC) family protein
MVLQLDPGGHIHFTTWEQLVIGGPAAKRLLMACAMGGAVGIEREWRHKDSGLRTNMLICMASALFTIMSVVLAGDSTPNKGQVAANIVQGIGFLGAGLILHTKNRVLGLTSAATVFVVAAIGMTCGAGLYLVALIATILLLLSLQAIGAVEAKLGWKRYPMIYEVRADVGAVLPSTVVGADRAEALAEDVAAARHRMQRAILKVLDSYGQRMTVQDRDNVAGMERVSFGITATRREHVRLLHELRESDATDQVVVFRDTEEE